jgi:hypothetical protein
MYKNIFVYDVSPFYPWHFSNYYVRTGHALRVSQVADLISTGVHVRSGRSILVIFHRIELGHRRWHREN